MVSDTCKLQKEKKKKKCSEYISMEEFCPKLSRQWQRRKHLYNCKWQKLNIKSS